MHKGIQYLPKPPISPHLQDFLSGFFVFFLPFICFNLFSDYLDYNREKAWFYLPNLLQLEFKIGNLKQQFLPSHSLYVRNVKPHHLSNAHKHLEKYS